MLLTALTVACGGSASVTVGSFTSTPLPLPTFTSTVTMLTTAPIIEAVPTVQPTATPTPEPVVVAQEVSHPNEIRAAPQLCYDNPDRYNWEKYALLVGFPEEVLPELSIIVRNESGGDLCAVNQSSGATCWIQQLPGGQQFFDPVTCMSQGYAKWLDGGRSFWRHWYQWWGR